MQQRAVATTAEPEIFVDVNGDLSLTGSDLNEVFAEADDTLELTADPAGAQVKLACADNCTVRVPRRARVTIHHVSGDARPIKDLVQALAMGDVGGDLVLRQTGPVTVGHVGGDVSAKKIAGPLTLASAGGDVSARSVAGPFASGTVGGDLYLRDVDGGSRGQAGGDVILNLDFAPGQTYVFSANGDIICRVPPAASARLLVRCHGDLNVDVPDAQMQRENGQHLVTLGAGAATVELQANSDVSISDVTTGSSGVAESGDDYGDRLSEQIEAQVAAKMAEIERELNAQFGELNLNLSGLGRMNAQAIAARARRAAETARRRQEAVQRKLEAAQRKVERAARHAEHADRRRTWGVNFTVPTPPRPPTPPKPPVDPVSNDERLAVLRMLEQGKISAADAEKLLAALEGKA